MAGGDQHDGLDYGVVVRQGHRAGLAVRWNDSIVSCPIDPKDETVSVFLKERDARKEYEIRCEWSKMTPAKRSDRFDRISYWDLTD